MKSLKNKTIVITGASSGIGEAMAREYAARGARVVLGARSAEKLERLTDEIRRAGGAAAWCAADIVRPEECEALVETAVREFGGIDVLVHCAGIGDIERAEDFDEKTWRKVIDVNLTGSFFMAQAVGKQMIKAGNGGKIICMASQAGIVAIDKHVAYSASKAGIISMVKSLAYEWGRYGIQVNAISPTATETPIIVGYWDVGEVHEKAIAGTPAGRFCKPEEIAAASFFLATEAANMITGANLVVDGGYTIH